MGFGILRQRLAPCIFLFLFWAVSVWNLDRLPAVHDDEVWILSPGYTLFTRGVYGSDLLAGFSQIENIYLEFMPLMSLLQGASARLFGLGVFQMRVVPVALGTLTLAFTYALGRTLDGRRSPVGLLSMLLLLFWQWSPPADGLFFSGVPLLDLSRIARYDILVAPLGLASLWCFIRAHETRTWRYYFLSGLCAGMAGLAHIYGLFWVIVLTLMALFAERPLTTDRRPPIAVSRLSAAVCILLGALLSWTPWLFTIAFNWDAYLGQNFQYQDRFALFDISFYARNVLSEPSRYHLGVNDAATFARVGFWLLVIGVPCALIWLARQGRAARWLCAPALLLPLLFALLISIKIHNYLAPIASLFALVMAAAMARLWQAQRRTVRVAAVALLALLIAQGTLGITQTQLAASQLAPPEKFFAELRATVPPSARVLGLPRFWLALSDHDYRSFILPFNLANPKISRQPIAFDAALVQVAPQIVLLDRAMSDYFAADASSNRAYRDPFWNYVQMHHARLLGELRDTRGEPVQVYQLDP